MKIGTKDRLSLSSYVPHPDGSSPLVRKMGRIFSNGVRRNKSYLSIRSIGVGRESGHCADGFAQPGRLNIRSNRFHDARCLKANLRWELWSKDRMSTAVEIRLGAIEANGPYAKTNLAFTRFRKRKFVELKNLIRTD